MPSIELPHTPGCLVCGRQNPIGLHLSLHVDLATGEIHTDFTPGPNHIGFEGLLHGGVLATVLDEAMVWAAIWSCRKACVAGELNVRFRNPGRVGARLTCLTRITAARSRLIETTGEITDADGSPIATATGKYIPLASNATDGFLESLVPEPTTIEATCRLIDGSVPLISHWEGRFLIRGRSYVVTNSFNDADGKLHPVGEKWTFLGSKFSRYDNLHILFTRSTKGHLEFIPLNTDAEQQKAVTDHFDRYVQPN